MSILDPSHIKRVGVAVELADGRRVIIYSDDPRAEVDIESAYDEPERIYGRGGEVTSMNFPKPIAKITISNLNHLVLQYFNDNSPGELIDAVQKKLTE